jgi:hypothetical protein
VIWWHHLSYELSLFACEESSLISSFSSSAAERKIQRHNQGIRTTINAKLIQTFQVPDPIRGSSLSDP